MLIRAAEAKDAKAICAIWNPVIRDTFTTFNSIQKTTGDIEDLIINKASLDHPMLVAQSDAGVVGFGTYGAFRGGIGYRHTMEHTVYLDPKAQGMGAGRAVLQALEDYAISRGVHALWAGISTENMGSVTFHEKLGYDVIARLPQVGYKFEKWIDLILMQKILS